MMRILTAILLALTLAPARASATPADLCEAAVETSAAKYLSCRLDAEAKFTKTLDADRRLRSLSKCSDKLAQALSSARSRNGGSNCTPVSDADLTTLMSACASGVGGAARLGGAIPCDCATPTPQVTLTPSPEPTAAPTPAPTATPIPSPTPTAAFTPTPTCTPYSVDNGKGGTYTDNCNGTVTDSTTGLVWEKKTGAGYDKVSCSSPADCADPHDVNNSYQWGEVSPSSFNGTAKTLFLDQLNCEGAFTSGCTPWLGRTDWRLPTILELSGRTDEGYAIGGIVDTRPGPECSSGNANSNGTAFVNALFGPTFEYAYWASSVTADYAWYANFNTCNAFYGPVTNFFFVRAVRGAEVSTRYIDNSNGTVTDSSTGLIWEKKTGTVTVGAFVYCTSGEVSGCHDPHSVNNVYGWSTGDNSFNGTAKTVFLDQLNCQGAYTSGCSPWLGHTDWRLPTIIELGGRDTQGNATGGIVDFTAPACTGGSPCIKAFFGPTRFSSYWSSSTYQSLPDFAWGVSFDTGNVYVGGQAGGAYVRAVRGGS
jgi:Protein of unknown function (DUF1566)